MRPPLPSSPITRREALKASAGIVAGAALSSVTPTLAAETSPKASRIQEYSWVRGFNYQPSWGSHGITIWNDFREATYARELDLGLKHFPKLNTLRIWFSYDAHVADPKRFLAAAKRAAELLAERQLKMIPVFFNGWHSLVDFGGFSIAQRNQSRNNANWGAHRQSLCELLEAIRPAGNLLMYDVSNKPFNNGGKEKGSIVVHFVRHELGLLKQAGIGFLPHALHHSPVADLHRPVLGRKWETMYMAFIEPARSIRPGHEVYNEF